MTERERLIELLKHNNCSSPMLCDPNCKYAELQRCYEERTADYLLANGVNVLPCKVGDMVYWIDSECISEGFIITIQMTEDEVSYTALAYYGEEIEFDDFEIDKTVFLTKEEAEKALEEKKKE